MVGHSRVTSYAIAIAEITTLPAVDLRELRDTSQSIRGLLVERSKRLAMSAPADTVYLGLYGSYAPSTGARLLTNLKVLRSSLG